MYYTDGDDFRARKAFSHELDSRLSKSASNLGITLPPTHKLSDQSFLLDGDANLVIENARKERKRCLLVFGVTREMNEHVFCADAVKSAASNIAAVKVSRESNPDIVKLFDVQTFPTYVLLSEDGVEIDREGNLMTVDQMTAFIVHTKARKPIKRFPNVVEP